METGDYFNEKKEKAWAIFNAQKDICNPYLKTQIVFNSDGFHHLQFSARHERNKKEQLLKFSLLPLAIHIIKNSGTLQEYRKTMGPIGKKSKRDGSRIMKLIEYWGFIAIVGENRIKIRTILRRIGDGNIIFWSVMPYSKLRRDEQQKLYTEGIEED